MFKKLRKDNQGFTIIEVLIVLAIAGLIMVIVFLAVPALQRNSRNTQYREEGSNLLAAAQEISTNKGGAVLTASGSGTANSDAAKVFAASNAKNITTLTIEAHSATAPAPSLTTAILRTGAKCTAADSAVALAGTTRQIAIYFMIETAGGGTQIQCVDS